MTAQPVDEQPDHSDIDLVIAGAMKTLLAARGLRVSDLHSIVGCSPRAAFQKLKGDSPWKASEVLAAADYFGVQVGAIYDGLGGLVRVHNDEAPRPSGRGASRSGAPSGTRTPDPLIKSQLL